MPRPPSALASSWIDAPTAERAGLFRVDSAEGAQLVGRKADGREYSGLAFPIYWPGENSPREYVLRRDHPELEERPGQSPKERGKYLFPPGRGNLLLFGPDEDPTDLADPSRTLLLVEGLKKLYSGWRLARHGAERPRFLVCAIAGVYNWRGKVARATDANGRRVEVKGPIPDLGRIEWKGRIVLIIFDSDAATNPQVFRAREALAEELRERGARVVIAYVPQLEREAKTGFDDLLAAWGPERVLEWLSQAEAAPIEDPEPISIRTPTLPELPGNLITGWLGDMIEATATATETPRELAAMMGLAVVATCTSKKFEIEVEPAYREPMNLWSTVALDPGCRKTPVLTLMTAPLLDWEAEQAGMMREAIASAQAERDTVEERIRHLRGRAARVEGEDFAHLKGEIADLERGLPEVPVPPRLWAQDVTPEKLGQLMAEHNERMALISDEGGIYETVAGRYSQGVPNLDLFLQAYSGSPYRVDRGSRPPLFLRNPALTIALTPQPDVLRGLAKKPGFRSRGFIARWLFALPASPLGHRRLEPHPVPPTVNEAYQRGIRALLAMSPREGDGDGHPRPHVLRPSEAARQEWKDFQRTVETDMREGGRFEHVTDWASKLPGAAARLVGLLHCAEHAGGYPANTEVGYDMMTRALEIAAVLSAHALAVFDLMAADPAMEAARRIWRWVERHKQTPFAANDVFHALKGTFPKRADLDPGFAILQERGYLFEVPRERRVGRPSLTYRVNGKLTVEWTT